MQVNDSRPFKATKSRGRLEAALVLVIIISFTWSAYALYKIAIGNTDSSLFGINISRAPSLANQTNSNSDSKHASSERGHLKQSAPSLVPSDTQLSPSEQLALYKSEILKELVARQKELLGTVGLVHQAQQQQQAISPTVLLAPSDLLSHLQEAHKYRSAGGGGAAAVAAAAAAQADLQGADRAVDYTVHRASQSSEQFAPAPVQANDSWHGSPNHQFHQPFGATTNASRVQLLHDAPSLGQLSSRANREMQMQTEAKLKAVGRGGMHGQMRDARFNSSARGSQLEERQPEESSLSEDLARDQEPLNPKDNDNDDDDDDGRSITAPLLTTTTTTQAPLFVQDIETTPSPMDTKLEEDDGKTDEEPNSVQDSELSNDDETTSGAKEQPDNSSDVPASSNNDEQQQQSDRVDEESMDRAKKAVRAIDEEVDRMTQPSIGSVSRHKDNSGAGSARSHHYKNTIVQFDDQPASHLDSNQGRGSQDGRQNKSSTGDLLRNKGKFQHKGPIKQSLAEQDLDPLQVADLIARRPLVHVTGHVNLKDSEDGQGSRHGNRTANSRKLVSKKVVHKRDLEAVDKNLLVNSDHDYLPPAGNGRRRSDDDDASEEDQEEDDDASSSTPSEDSNPKEVKVIRGEPSLQELLAHKQLLESLRQSTLPAPTVQPSTPDVFNMNARPGLVNRTDQQQQVQAAGASQGLVDHVPASNNVYSVDEGLLLTQAGEDDHGSKSMSKKKMKKKKAKKKLTMAIKKGGHKKKKHKKEEKKYLKEKKFKGAKKGKKMHKGKGGKGGKKGSKFYKDKGFKKKGFKNIYVKNEFGQKKSYFDEFRDKDFKKKWKNFDEKYNYAQMKKWQAKDIKGAKKMKDQGEKYKKYDKGKWKKKYHKEQASESSKKKKHDHFK